jgi:tetratricopeptide (TPR) repeat protein
MKWQELMRSRRYADAVPDLRQYLANSPDDIGAQQAMAKALRATGQYREALSFYERIAAHRRQEKVANIMAPGSAPWDIDIACLHWIFAVITPRLCR